MSLTFMLPFEKRYHLSQQWSRFVIWWLKETCGINYRVQGIEHIPKEPVVILAKHQSTWETLFLHQFLPPLAIVVKRELLWLPFFGWGLAMLEPIKINRKQGSVAMRQVLKQGKTLLEKGRGVLIFPEGTRTKPEERKPYNIGGAMLAVHSEKSVLPIAHNAGKFWPRKGFIKRPGTVQVTIGNVIESKNLKANELNKLVEQWIEDTMTRITDENRGNKNQVNGH